ncbi:MAG: MmcQ/YjbR family DNA-binding protein [Bacteroidales bacterium]
MEIEEVIDYAITLPHVEQEYKAAWETLLLKIGGKIFVLIPLDTGGNPVINLKCDPERAEELRMRYEAIHPGFHMNKQHWNTVYLYGHLPAGLLQEMISDSYHLVYNGLTRKVRKELEDSAQPEK